MPQLKAHGLAATSNRGVKVQMFVGAEKAELATVGARASKFHKEFKNGIVVGHGKATSV